MRTTAKFTLPFRLRGCQALALLERMLEHLLIQLPRTVWLAPIMVAITLVAFIWGRRPFC